MIPRQPSMWRPLLVVLLHMELIARPDKRPALLQVHLHDAQPRRMARGMVHYNPMVQVEVRLVKRLPVQLLQQHIMAQIDAEVGLCGDSPACMLEFLLVHIDRHVCVDEVLQAPRVVEVQVAHDYRLDVFDVVAGFGDRGGESIVLFVGYSREDVGDVFAPVLCFSSVRN